MTYNNTGKMVKALVIGDLIIDHYIVGSCDRISPEAPIPVVEVTHETHTLGGAGNVLKNFKALGGDANIISVTGADSNADLVRKLLRQNGVQDPVLVNDSKRCTTIKSRVLVSNHQLVRMDREVTAPIDLEIEKIISERFNALLADTDIVMLSDYNKGLLTNSLLKKLISSCKQAGIKTLLDPKGAEFSKYEGVYLIKPNKKEAALATGIAIEDRESLEKACIKIKALTACEVVVITLSENGIALYVDEKLTIIPTQGMGVIDVTGAGDTVLASLAIVLASGGSFYDACAFANQAAAVVVSKVGSATATIGEINEKHFKPNPLA